MIGFFSSSNLAGVRAALGVLESDIKAATRTASSKAFRWAGREAARGIAKAAGIPYKAGRIRTKTKGRIDASGRVWFGLNAVSAKYLTQTGQVKRARAGKTFTNDKLNGHFFRRKDKARLPIERDELAIESDALTFIEGPFVDDIRAKLVEEFLLALDRRGGRTAGTSKTIIGA